MDKISSLWNHQLFHIGETEYTIGQFILLALLLIAGYGVSKLLEFLFSRRLSRTDLRPHVIQTLKRLVFYLLFIGVVLAALSVLHIPMATFAFLTGAVAIGIGFGAQNIINNFISGWILMTEKPVRTGDFVEIDQHTGIVEYIGNRSTQIRRVDGVHILVPNSQMLERVVVNWTLVDNNIRTYIRIGVAYGSKAGEVARLLEQAVCSQSDVLLDPAPSVIFDDFGDNALIFEAIFWCNVAGERALRQVRSNIRFKISELFTAENITIAFPQRDVHIDSLSPLKVEMVLNPQNKELMENGRFKSAELD
ncbi:MAG: small-conductance mechanosensitive channel [Bacteroidia bacterium]|jgi:small-conductance mechanosensitive channel